MKVMIIFKKGYSRNMRVMVKLHTKSLKDSFSSLINENRKREAFELIVSKAQVAEYIPPGEKILKKPAFILKEDLLD